MLFDLFSRSRREGLSAIEADVEDPSKSKTFTAYPVIMKDHHVLSFICDTLRTATSGAVEPFDIDQMMELDMDVHHHEATEPVAALSTVADSLPGLGIVAAVLGVVITMGALGGPPEEIGHKVAAALVGTFLGHPAVLWLSRAHRRQYGQNRGRRARLLLRPARGHDSFIKGTAPILAVEIGRRAIPGQVRPGFQELGKAVPQEGAGSAAAAA